MKNKLFTNFLLLLQYTLTRRQNLQLDQRSNDTIRPRQTNQNIRNHGPMHNQRVQTRCGG